MFFGLNAYVIGAVAAVVATLGVTVWWQQSRVEDLTQRAAAAQASALVMKGAVESANATVALLIKRNEEQQQRMVALEGKVLNVTSERNNARAQLDSYRRRIDAAALAKPKLVGSLASKSIAGVMQQFYEATRHGAREGTGGTAGSAPPAAQPGSAP